MSTKFIISEEERTSILSQHGLVNEQILRGMIPNPRKEIIVNLPIDKVSEILDNIVPLLKVVSSGYENYDKSSFTKSWTLQKTEFISLGVFIDISLTEIDTNKTKIEIEVRRKVGGFDNALEVQKANEHIRNILKAIENGTNPQNLDKAKADKPNPASPEGMGITVDQWHSLGRPNIVLMYENGFKSYQEWVDAGKPELKGFFELEREKKRKKKEQERAELEAKGIKPKTSFWGKLFGDK